MSETEQDVEQFLRDQVFSGKPASPSQAAAVAEPPPPDPPPAEEMPPENAPVVVTDEPTPPAPPPAEMPAEPTVAPTEETVEEEPDEFGENEHTVWAKKKYGDQPEKWAKAAFDQEQHISRMSREKAEVEQVAQQWYEYAKQLEQGQQQQTQHQMPLSASEEQWVENSVTNPLEFARQAAFQGKVGLYNAVINRIAEENPVAAGNLAAAVQMELAEYAALEQAAQNGTQQKPPLQEAIGASFQRLGINLQQHGPRMSEKIAELGEYNPLVQAIMDGDDAQRDLAVRAVYEMTPTTTVRRVGNDEAIRRENELRRDAAVVQTGGIQPPPPPPGAPSIIEAMRAEWRERGQYPTD